MKNKKLLVLSLSAMLGVAGFLSSNHTTKVNLAKAEELGNLGDMVNRPSMNLYGDTKTQMGFNWETTNLTDSDLEVVLANDSLKFESTNVKKFKGEVFKSTVSGDGFIHKVNASDLTPDSEYIYRFGDSELNEWCEEGRFKTSSNEGKNFSFTHLSDPQGSSEEHYDYYHTVLEQVEKTNTSFIALTGDTVNNSWADHTPVLTQWDWALDKQWDILKNIPVVDVAGNHEGALNDFASRFNFKVAEGSSTSNGVYYSFTYENVHFIGLNTNDAGDTIEIASGLSEHQVNWLKNDLEENKNAKFTVVLMHKGIFDSGSHCSNVAGEGKDYDVAYIREQLAPLFTQYGVSLVLQGHDHLYSESCPTISNVVDSEYTYEAEDIKTSLVNYDGVEVDTYVDPKGTIYLNTGTASGSKYYSSVAYDKDIIHINETQNGSLPCFTNIDIISGTIVCKTYEVGSDGETTLKHSFAINKSKYNGSSGDDSSNPGSSSGDKPGSSGCSGTIVASSTIACFATAIGLGALYINKNRKKDEDND